MAGVEKKYITKSKIMNYMMTHQNTSKAELAKNLNLSMPTVLSNVNDLLAKKVIVENGEYESTGGRKAKSIGINPSCCYAVGVSITANHVGMVLVNLQYEIEKWERKRIKFEPDAAYCVKIGELVNTFLQDVQYPERILGVGVSIPGIIDKSARMVQKSHALQLENYSLNFLEQAIPFPLYFENDANAAMMAEDLNKYQNGIYLSLNNTLGGAFCIDGKLIQGKNHKAGEFGHMILYPGGRRCYCGKAGCADAYCAASTLIDEKYGTLEEFMNLVTEGEEEAVRKWEKYLDDLAILISNLRMAYDMDIILGGEIGGYMSDYMFSLGEKVMAYNGFDHDVRYLKNCKYKREASAVGAAKYFLEEFIKNM